MSCVCSCDTANTAANCYSVLEGCQAVAAVHGVLEFVHGVSLHGCPILVSSTPLNNLRVVVDDGLAIRLVEAGSKVCLSHGQTDGVADTLAQGTCAQSTTHVIGNSPSGRYKVPFSNKGTLQI